MKIANILLVHKNPEQVIQLLKKLDHPQIYNFIHLDKKIEKSPFEECMDLERVYFIKNRTNVNWGGFSMLKAFCISAGEIIDQKLKFSYINLMSGQDYLIQPIEKFVDYLEKNDGKEFIEYRSVEFREEDKAKVYRYHFSDWKFKGSHKITFLINKILGTRKFPFNQKIMVGSNWMALTEKSWVYILRYIKDNPKYYDFFKMVWSPEEVFFQTILFNSAFQSNLTNDNLRYIDWSENNPSPKILREKDLPELLNSGKFLARKFDISIDQKIIKLIDIELNKIN